MSLGLKHQQLVDINNIDSDCYSIDSHTPEEIDEAINDELSRYGNNKLRLPIAFNPLFGRHLPTLHAK